MWREIQKKKKEQKLKFEKMRGIFEFKGGGVRGLDITIGEGGIYHIIFRFFERFLVFLGQGNSCRILLGGGDYY